MVFDGKQAAVALKEQLAEKISQYSCTYGRTPCLEVILVGNDYGSTRYAESCVKQALSLGMLCRLVRMQETASEQDVTEAVAQANEDNEVDGILVQMPLPKGISAERVISRLRPDKDVDGVTDANVAALWKQRSNDYSRFCVPCTPRSVMRILQTAGVRLDGKRTIVVGRSNIVGLPVSKLLMNENCTVTVAHSHTADLATRLREAEIIVAAIGKAKFITADMVGDGAVVIDVGINSDPLTGKMCGDVDYDSVADKCSLITPVPGGVGPLTICSLIENTLDCYLRHKQKFVEQ